MMRLRVARRRPWMDVPELGWSVMVTTDGNRVHGQEVADRLGRAIWADREAFRVPKVPVTAAIARARASAGIRVVLTREKASQLDASIYHRAGVLPTAVRILQVKSAGGFRAAYDPFSADTIYLDTPGPCDSDLTRLPFVRIDRPLWPFDADLAEPWEGAGAATD